MSWGNVRLADGATAKIGLAPDGELDHSEPWTTMRLPSGHELLVPTEAIVSREGEYHLSLSLTELGLDPKASPDTVIIPVIAEELEIERVPVVREHVRVHTRLEVNSAVVEETLLHEHVEVERVTIDREVGGPQPVRQEGDVTIIPVVEEILVVQKRFVLKEEVRVRRRRVDVPSQRTVELRRQNVEVFREPAEVGDEEQR